MLFRAIVLAVATAAAAAQSIPPGADIPLCVINPDSVTVSGISSGAFQAVQMHVSFSLLIKGAGVLAGGPYWCAQDNVFNALNQCMTGPNQINVLYLFGIAENTALFGFIDPLIGLANSRVWLLSALNDSVVATGVVEKNVDLYSMFLSHAGSTLHADYSRPGEHSQLTADYGSPCTFLGEPYINNCGFDAAGDMLQWVYSGNLTPPLAARLPLCALDPARVPMGSGDGPRHWQAANVPACSASERQRAPVGQAASPPGGAASASSRPVLRAGNGTLYAFDQGLFVGGGLWSSVFGLAQTAFVYIPDACLLSGAASANGAAPAGGCLLHMAFHGCEQSTDDIGHAFMTGGGYLPWAEANSMVVVFPQAIANVLNPKSCFDWWGFTGTAYASNWGTQPLAMKNVLEVLIGRPITPNRTATHGHAAAHLAWAATAMGGGSGAAA